MSFKLAGQHEHYLLHQQHFPSQAKSVFLARLPSGARGRTLLHFAAEIGYDATVERLLAAGANVDAVDSGGRGLGAGRVDPDFTQICRNLTSEHYHFCGFTVSICLNSLKLWSDVVGKGRLKSYVLKYHGTDTCFYMDAPIINSAENREPFLHQLPTLCLAAKQNASPFECPRSDAIVSVGGEWP